MKILVINLPTRPERMASFEEKWKWLPHERVEGIFSNVPHTGCGLAHIRAIRKGLGEAEWCLVLEDDARLLCSPLYFMGRIQEALSGIDSWDAVFLGAASHTVFPQPERIQKVSDHFFTCSRTKSIRSCSAMLWSRSALPLLEEFERILQEGHSFAIDRYLTSHRYPWVYEPADDSWDEDAESRLFLIEKIPRVWICSEHLVYQEPGIHSDNTGEAAGDYRESSIQYLQKLSDLSTQGSQEPNPLPRSPSRE